MAQDDIQKSGTASMYKNDRGGATLITEPVIGVVKDNVDPTRSGRVRVYLSNYGSSGPNDSNGWVTVGYLSPFCGTISPNNSPVDGPDKTGYGKYLGNPHSYGFWASAPDIGTEVLCIFVNGDINAGYYIGCLPKSGLLQMTPAIGSSAVVVPNGAEAATYGGADKLPTTEVNYSNPNLKNSPTIVNDPKPVHSYQAAILANQGLVRDNIRGVVSSSAQRETPSRVFGMSTPGGPVYEGGYSPETIKAAARSADQTKLKLVGRTGGHTFVMDDGTVQGDDQLIRLRSSGGHQIMMSDSGETLFIIHANGQSWIELGKEGTVDMFATNSVNIRTQGDLNLHADRDININAKRNFNMYADNVALESDKNISFRAGVDFISHAIGKFTAKSGKDLSMFAGAEGSFASNGTTYINGKKINLNSGNSGTVPAAIPTLTKVNHPDTVFSQSKGWMYPGTQALISVASRVPTHMPWAASGKGVDVKISAAVNTVRPDTTPVVDRANAAAPAAPTKKTTEAITNSVPPVKTSTPQMNTQTATAIAGQQAMNNSRLTPKEKAENNILPGKAGLTTTQATAPGAGLMPGAQVILDQRLKQGMPMEKAMQGLTTGNLGVGNPKAMLTNTTAQLSMASNSYNNAIRSLTNAGILTGRESAAQLGGVVLAAAVQGPALVAGVINGITTGVAKAGQVLNNIASGKFAGQLSDSISSGLKGLADSVSGTISGIGNTIKGIATSLSGTLKAAFTAVESSFKNLAANKPNILGLNKETDSKADLTSSSAKYASAEAEIESAQTRYDEARAAYRNNPDEINKTILDSAEAEYANARKKGASVAAGFITGGVAAVGTSIANTAKSIQTGLSKLITPATTANSGINALPGGISVIGNQVTNLTSNPLATAKNTLSSIVGSAGNPLTNPVNFAGNLVKNTAAAVTNTINGVIGAGVGIVNGVVGAATGVVTGVINTGVGIVNGAVQTVNSLVASATGIASSIKTALSSLASGSNQVKPPTMATETFNIAPMIAKIGKLIDDARVTLPGVRNPSQKDMSVSEADANKKQQTESLDTIKKTDAEISDLLYKQAMADLGAAKGNLSTEQYQTSSLELGEARARESLKQEIAQNNYETATTGTTTGPAPQSSWSKFWSGDKSDSNKYFQW
jgi:hypothetical protein